MSPRLVEAAVRVALLIAGLLVARSVVRRHASASAGAAGGERDRDRSLGALLKRGGLWTLALLLSGGCFALLAVTAGLVPIKASSGHWPITAWFLKFAMQRSVATHTIGISVPDLDEPRLVLKGAGHYELGCRSCHGSPAARTPRIARAMTPPPPDLMMTVPQYDAAELFYIIKHGVKFTGMPAWPAQQRDDEVWAVVAFVRKLPALDSAAYEQLVAAAPAAGDAGTPIDALLPHRPAPMAIASCAGCHGIDGRGRGLGAFPRLAGQQPAYLEASLRAYARSERHSGIMEPIAAGLDAAQISEVARYYADVGDGRGPAGTRDAAPQMAAGEAIATRGLPDQLVPPCAECHGPAGPPRNPAYPRLAGQHADYIRLQLRLFQERRRGGTAYQGIMRRVASGLTDEQMRAVAAYYASIPAAVDQPAPGEP